MCSYRRKRAETIVQERPGTVRPRRSRLAAQPGTASVHATTKMERAADGVSGMHRRGIGRNRGAPAARCRSAGLRPMGVCRRASGRKTGPTPGAAPNRESRCARYLPALRRIFTFSVHPLYTLEPVQRTIKRNFAAAQLSFGALDSSFFVHHVRNALSHRRAVAGCAAV